MAAACNYTIEDNSLCTFETCCIEQAQIAYIPTKAGNGVYAGIFAVLFLGQLFFGIRHRTWGFLAAMLPGIALEVLGYAGRIWLAENIFADDPFLMYLICLTIAPAFLSAGLYLCLGRIVKVYGEQYSRIRAGTYTLIFVPCDFLALVLQAAGGAIASVADTESLNDIGINIMIAGLAWQVFSLFLFMAVCLDFMLRVKRGKSSQRVDNFVNKNLSALASQRRFKFFLYALGIATATITIRSIYRVAELSQGFSGTIANDEPSFMVLEGPMIIIAVLVLTVWHPGTAFAGLWQEANFRFRKSKGQHGLVASEDSEEQLRYNGSAYSMENHSMQKVAHISA